MKHFLLIVLMAGLAIAGQAQNSIVGNWTTVDDETGERMSVVTIYKGTDGLYYGKVAKLLVEPTDAVCVKCEGEDHNKPVEGLIIIRGMKMENGELVGGRVLDPKNGKFYYGKIYLKGGKLVLRGSLDKRGLLGRNQTWLPAE